MNDDRDTDERASMDMVMEMVSDLACKVDRLTRSIDALSATMSIIHQEQLNLRDRMACLENHRDSNSSSVPVIRLRGGNNGG